MPFRFSARRALLTYSQVCERVTKETILYSLLERYSIERYVIGEEAHEDQGRHVHAALTFHTKIDTRDPAVFDINCGHCTTDHHPNIQPIRRGQANLLRAEEYCSKEDPTPLTNVEPKLTWGEIIEQASSQDEYLSLVQKHYPRDFCLSLERLKTSASYLFPATDPNTINAYAWTAEEEPTAWETIDSQTQTWDPLQTSLVIIGAPGCGKTTWAKLNALKPSLFIRHLDSLQYLRPHHKSIIFDDLSFVHLPVATQKYLVDCQDLAEIHLRYRIGRIPAGTQKIFTGNEYPFESIGIHGEAISRRVTKIDLFQ